MPAENPVEAGEFRPGWSRGCRAPARDHVTLTRYQHLTTRYDSFESANLKAMTVPVNPPHFLENFTPGAINRNKSSHGFQAVDLTFRHEWPKQTNDSYKCK